MFYEHALCQFKKSKIKQNSCFHCLRNTFETKRTIFLILRISAREKSLNINQCPRDTTKKIVLKIDHHCGSLSVAKSCPSFNLK